MPYGASFRRYFQLVVFQKRCQREIKQKSLRKQLVIEGVALNSSLECGEKGSEPYER